MKTSEYLEDWADEVEDRPHYKGGLGDWMKSGGEACMVGSDMAQRCQKVVAAANAGLDVDPIFKAHDHAHKIVHSLIGTRNVGGWNDAEERTKQNVVDVLRKAAKTALREEEGLDPE